MQSWTYSPLNCDYDLLYRGRSRGPRHLFRQQTTDFQPLFPWFSAIIFISLPSPFEKSLDLPLLSNKGLLVSKFFVWRIFAKSHCQSEVLIKFKANLTSHFHHASQFMHTALVRWLTTSHCGWSRARTAMSVSLKLRCVTSCWLESVRDHFHIYCLMIWYLWFHQESYKGNLPSMPFCRYPWRGVIVPLDLFVSNLSKQFFSEFALFRWSYIMLAFMLFRQ